MVLEFLKGQKQPTAQEAVAYVDDGTTGGDYGEGEVVANISALVAVDGPEDVLAYVNGAIDTSGDATGTDEVADVALQNGEVVLDPGLAAATDIPTADQSVAEEGGLFFSPDEAQTGEELNATDDYSGLDSGTEYFAYTDNAGSPASVEVSNGIDLVVQASGY